jgi:hypothetical protein
MLLRHQGSRAHRPLSASSGTATCDYLLSRLLIEGLGRFYMASNQERLDGKISLITSAAMTSEALDKLPKLKADSHVWGASFPPGRSFFIGSIAICRSISFHLVSAALRKLESLRLSSSFFRNSSTLRQSDWRIFRLLTSCF